MTRDQVTPNEVARHYLASPPRGPSWLGFLVVAMASLVLRGCAATHPYRSTLDPQLPRQHELDNVTFFPQTKLHCGPAALATTLVHAGFTTEPDQLTPTVFTSSRRGSVPLDMLGGARRSGALAVELPPSLNALFAEIAAGRPVIVLQNLGLSWYPVWHYAVVVGYDIDRGEVVLRSGTTHREMLSLRTFVNTWSRSGQWSMITLRPGDMSQQVDASNYAAAVVALERIGNREAATRAYDAGVMRWPTDLVLLIGAGNMAYKSGNLEAAETHYRGATLHHPNSDAALNNLAQVLADRGRVDEAIEMASKAIAINGPQAAAARSTLSTLQEKNRDSAR